MKNKTFNKQLQFFLLRLLVSPMVLALMTVGFTYSLIKRFLLYLRYGVEFISFEENEQPTVNDIYKEMKAQRERLNND